MHDYIIVGAGSAGCVLAARLSEDPATRVLLLEDGPFDDHPDIKIPGKAMELWQSRFSWQNVTTPQRHAGDRRIPWPSGRTLGGSSSINGIVYMRGNPLDYDTWRDTYGCTGWGYANLLPYFRRAEDQQHGDSFFHGVGGPLRVEDPRYRDVLSKAWVRSAIAAGLPANPDFNGAVQDGVGFHQFTQRGGERWSTADAYLRPAMRRDNLTVQTDAQVTKVLVDNGRAVGVRLLKRGVERELTARDEVIVCAGAVNSPKLLMLSGIGPAEHLREHGIDVVMDAPMVGRGLQDHPLCLPQWSTPDIPSLLEEATPENLALWHERRQGPLASSITVTDGFERSRDDLPAPDLQYGAVNMAASVGPDGLVIEPDRRAVTLLVIALAVNSRGQVMLSSANPDATPLINPAYLSDDADLETLVAGVTRQREIASCQPLAGLTAGEFTPGENVDNDERLRAWVRRSVTTHFHPTSTCAMGSAQDTVCDPQLRVRGIDGLRIVDASVMPAIPRGNTNAPTIALAERATDLIRANTPLTPADVDS